jgi:phospholipase/lecithinase/hemolysin
MYLHALGASRDRTADLMSFRGASLKSIRPNRDISDGSLALSQSPPFGSQESPLERFFQLAGEIKHEIANLHVLYDALLKKHKACLRPTFTDPADSINEVEAATASINMRMQTVQRQIGLLAPAFPDYPDRGAIVRNLRAAVTEAFRDFSAKFRLEQQAFSASYGRSAEAKRSKKKADEDDLLAIDFGAPGGQQRQAQFQQQRNEEAIEQMARRAAEIRNIFVELANLVAEQGAIVDRIDHCIAESLANATVAHEEVVQAAKYQGKSRMWICVVLLFVLVVILFLLAWNQ